MTSAAKLDQLFQALSDATRRDILRRLLTNALSVSEIAEPYDMTIAAVGKHLRTLVDAGLISTVKTGRIRHATINIEQLRLLQIWLEGVDDTAALEFDALLEALIEDD